MTQLDPVAEFTHSPEIHVPKLRFGSLTATSTRKRITPSSRARPVDRACNRGWS